MCEVWNTVPNTDELTRQDKYAQSSQVLWTNISLLPWIGFEQEYTLFKGSRPLGFPSEQRFPAAQGPYYCGVGADEVAGRDLVEEHLDLCLQAGLSVQGVNAEVMPGQWEFQIGGPNIDPVRASDELWIARWLLYRLGEKYGISATLDPNLYLAIGTAQVCTQTSQSRRLARRMVLGDLQILDRMSGVEFALEHYGHDYEIRLTGDHGRAGMTNSASASPTNSVYPYPSRYA